MALAKSRSIEGTDAIWLRLLDRHRKMSAGLGRGLRAAAEHLLEKARPLAPIDTGDLRQSAAVMETGRGKTLEYSVVFTMPYAVYQHENLAYNHPRGGQAKYLETPFREERAVMNAIITKAVRGAK